MSRNVIRGFLSILSAEVGSLLIGLLITPVLVRLLGSSAYGDYVFVLSALSIAVIVVNAGVNDGIRKFIAEERTQPAWESHVFAFYMSTATLLAIGGAVVFIAVSASGLIAQTLGQRFELYAYLAAALLVGRQLFQTGRNALMGLGLEQYSEPLAIVQKLLFGITGISLTYIGWDVAGALAGHILATGIVCIVAFGIVAQQVDMSHLGSRLPPDFPVRELLTFNLGSVVLVLLMTSLYHVDILLLRVLTSGEQTGYYRAALLVAEFLWFAPFALQMVLLHSMSETWSQGRHDEVSEVASRATRYTLSLTVLLALGIAALADAFVPLYYGAPFAPASTVVVYLLPGALGFAIARPIFAISQAKGELTPLIAATGAAALLNLLLNLVLIPRHGMYGAAIATSVGYGSMLLLHIWAARRVGFDPISDIRVRRVVTTAAVAAVAIFGIDCLLDSPLLSLLIVPAVGGCSYALVAIQAGVVDTVEIDAALARLPPSIRDYLSPVLRTIQ
ncbi:lipopolysaccharide biosynthesis protein [Halosimplex pelagicum]|uniref:Polysaccharide biosynthesis C-terminal domain-containing protein n=1 Tax=Halosimplex pelagicum TaxID=869886 RepID=A0A7D5P7N5_9EURY|nr:polysaccharide biosynthesis C-terminal domain-containing protein [Halosimplex pelagicum]QLH81261.1 polysaccharide biosynthesis C-terminal domain-containing protein [Halosimplex pelagicum]